MIDLTKLMVRTDTHGTTNAARAIGDLVSRPGFAPKDWQSSAPMETYKSVCMPVGDSEDLQRIIALPRRAQTVPGSERAAALVQRMTARNAIARTTPCECAAISTRYNGRPRPCITTLNLAQSAALHEITLTQGMLGFIGVGHGKTILNLLAVFAFRDARVAVLLVPVTLVTQLIAEYEFVGQHFRMPSLIVHGKVKLPGDIAPHDYQDLHPNPNTPVLHVLPYSRLSTAAAAVKLEEIAPDVIICDEVHNLRHADTARTSRLLKYFERHESTKFAGWSGSITDASLEDYGHLAALALRERSPVPNDPETLKDWGRALDPKPAGASDDPYSPWASAAPPGALMALCAPGEHIAEGFHRRLVETPGIITTSAAAVDCELSIEEMPAPPIPGVVTDALNRLREEWIRPDGEELIDALTVARCARELACGFYYRWKFPPINGVPQDTRLILEWLDIRRDYRKELRSVLARRADHMDSPLLCEHAAKRYHGDLLVPPREHKYSAQEWDARHPEWQSLHWPAWRDIKSKVQPETEAVRLDPYLALLAAEWAHKNRGIVWYEANEFGTWVAELSGLTKHGGGPDAGKLIARETGERSIICSIKSHGTGRDGLQRLFSTQLIAQPPSSATCWEQCLDSETEILTESGWLGIDSPTWGQSPRVAAYDVTDGSVAWSAITGRTDRLLDGETMYGVSNPHLDIRVTAGHRMVVEPLAGSVRGVPVSYEARRFVTADAMPLVGRIPITGDQVGEGVPLTDDELTFLGLFMSDGNKDPSNNTVALFQSERYPEIIALIERTIAGCRFKARHSVTTKPSNFGPRSPLHKWAISYSVKGAPHLRGWGPLAQYIDKGFPSTLDAMTARQLRVFLHGLWAGDGGKTAGTYAYDRYTSSTLNIATKRRTVADRLQSLCARRGMRCNVSTTNTGLHMLRISEDNTWHVKTRSSDTRPVWGPLPGSPDERVWCVSVPTGAIITRRNGKVAVVGNCLGRLARIGQLSPVVYAHFWRHTEELKRHVDQALARALYVQTTLGSAQKLRTGFIDRQAINAAGSALSLSELLSFSDDDCQPE